MNSANISREEIYNWLRKEMIAGLRATYNDIDFDDLEIMKKVYSYEINRFNKGVGKLYIDKEKFNEKLAEEISKADSDIDTKTASLCRYCGTERGKLVVIVLDNCDKRLRDEQLLMFQVAEWLQKTFRVLVILPLREETFDDHRNEPPLDTALKDMVFRIEPAPFQEVLTTRVQMAMNEIQKCPSKPMKYTTPNGMRVGLTVVEQAYYL